MLGKFLSLFHTESSKWKNWGCRANVQRFLNGNHMEFAGLMIYFQRGSCFGTLPQYPANHLQCKYELLWGTSHETSILLAMVQQFGKLTCLWKVHCLVTDNWWWYSSLVSDNFYNQSWHAWLGNYSISIVFLPNCTSLNPKLM